MDMAKSQYVAASVHRRNEFGEFISSVPIYVEAEDEGILEVAEKQLLPVVHLAEI